MKKIISITIILLFIAIPIFASGIVEGGLGGGASGALLGFLIGGPVGAIVGGIGGAAVGGTVGGVKQKKEEEAQNEQYNVAIASLETENETLAAQNSSLTTALNTWGNQYKSALLTAQDEGEAELRARKENWGLTDANLAAQERGGITAQLISKQAKNRVISYAGEDMILNSGEVEKAVAKAFSSTDTSDLRGLDNKNYGIYETELIATITSLQKSRRDLEDTIDLNKRAIATNEESIGRYEKLKKDFFFI